MSDHNLSENLPCSTTGAAYPPIPIDVHHPSQHQLAVHPHHGTFHDTIELWEYTKIADPYTYLFGYGNDLSSEAIPDTLPRLGNSPLCVNHGLFAEQINGTSFTTPRVHNRRSWVYKIRPSAAHPPFQIYTRNKLLTNSFDSPSHPIDAPRIGPQDPLINTLLQNTTSVAPVITPNQLRWKPFPVPKAATTSSTTSTSSDTTANEISTDNSTQAASDKNIDFVDGLATIGGAGSPAMKQGFAVHVYTANTNMSTTQRSMANSDGDLLFVPQLTPLLITTTFGRLRVAPGEICVIPRGIRFSIDFDFDHDFHTPLHARRVGLSFESFSQLSQYTNDSHEVLQTHAESERIARGYICEVYDNHFVIPDLGPIGANGLAHARHFVIPTAYYSSPEPSATTSWELIQKFAGQLFSTSLDTSPYDVVGWSGNYYPVKYDLSAFNTLGSISYDHIDPSIFTVLTASTTLPGTAAIDFVIFPPRWAVQENTFRPPYYHLNCMSEFMGNIMGSYDAKPNGFFPGGASLHSCMIGHGPDDTAFTMCSDPKTAPIGPKRMSKNDLAFMFESTYMMKLTPWALQEKMIEQEYYQGWTQLPRKFGTINATAVEQKSEKP